jgi:hypothetical protein
MRVRVSSRHVVRYDGKYVIEGQKGGKGELMFGQGGAQQLEVW